jgi:hypothetical protein
MSEMQKMPSSEFRKSYASLTERTLVTVNGHIIGVWTPRDSILEQARLAGQEAAKAIRDMDLSARPIRPAPKPSHK